MYGPTGLFAMRVDTTWYYLMKDHLNSTRVLFNKSGVVSSTYDFDAYGKLGRSTINTDIKYRFTGQEFDVESGLHNFRARNYDSDLGMFYASDPAGEHIRFSKLTRNVSLSRYYHLLHAGVISGSKFVEVYPAR